VTFFFLARKFGDGRTDSGFCLPETSACVQKRNKIRSLRRLSSNFGILIGVALSLAKAEDPFPDSFFFRFLLVAF
jgi:hypothetical protein